MADRVYAWFLSHSRSEDASYPGPVRAIDDYTQRTAAHYAARHGNVDILRRLYLADKAQLDASQKTPRLASILVKKDYMQETPLMTAVQYDQEDVVRAIIAISKRPILSKDESGWTVLHYAARYNASPRIVALFGGLDTDKVLASNSDSGTPLEIALLYGNGDVVAALVQSYPQFRDVLYKGQHLMQIAAEKGYTNLITALYNVGSTAAMDKDERGETPLIKAILLRNVDTAMEIARRFPASARIGYEYVSRNGQSMYKQPHSLTHDEDLSNYLKEITGAIIIPKKPRGARTPRAKPAAAAASSSTSTLLDDDDNEEVEDAVAFEMPAFRSSSVRPFLYV